MENNIRKWMRLVEGASPAEAFIQQVETAFVKFGTHIQIMMMAETPTEVWIESISATPMRKGWGSKALKLLCGLATKQKITLALEVAQDEDDEWGDEDEDEDADDEDAAPSSDQLIDLYSRFGFEIGEQTRYDRTRMVRKP